LYEAHENKALRIAERLSAIGGFDPTSPGRLLSGFTGITTDDLGLQPLRLARALAQHYLHNTSFVDVTFDPAVAVFFATNRFKDGTYHQATDAGILFRWPARRQNKLVLTIEDNESRIEVVDLQALNPWFLRPHTQRGAVAMPVIVDPFEQVLSGRFCEATPSAIIDMAALECCEAFELSLSTELPVEVPSADAMFPDDIDFGYAFAALWSFLSIVAHHPDDTEFVLEHTPAERASLLAFFEEAMNAVVTILEHELRRLFRDIPWRTNTATFSVLDSLNALEACRHAAIQAVTDSSPERQQRREEWESARVAHYLQKRRLLAEVIQRESGLSVEVVPPTPRDFQANSDWVVDEIQKRYSDAMAVGSFCAHLPAYYCVNKDSTPLAAALDCSEELIASIRRQATAVESWLHQPMTFTSDTT
jgi:hypothetical protein